MPQEAQVKVKTVTMKEAQEIALNEYGIEVSIQTINNWVTKKHLGHQPSGSGGHWRVFEEKFRKHISGEKQFTKEG